MFLVLTILALGVWPSAKGSVIFVGATHHVGLSANAAVNRLETSNQVDNTFQLKDHDYIVVGSGAGGRSTCSKISH